MFVHLWILVHCISFFFRLFFLKRFTTFGFCHPCFYALQELGTIFFSISALGFCPDLIKMKKNYLIQLWIYLFQQLEEYYYLHDITSDCLDNNCLYNSVFILTLRFLRILARIAKMSTFHQSSNWKQLLEYRTELIHSQLLKIKLFF